ncbi:MAG TPA: asparaginase [Mesorhizobium sp.]
MNGEIIFIGAGGTIGSLGRDPHDILHYHSTGNRLSAAEILNSLPASPVLSSVEPVEFRNLDSTAVTAKDWRDLAGLCERLAAEKPSLAGIVIGHGTASLEETAFCLSLTMKLAIPVVVTGAMRPLNGISSDAARNLVAAIHVARSARSAGRGVLVVFNDEIHAAREVTKTSTSRLDAFRSPDRGPLGEVRGDEAVFYRRSERRHMADSEFSVEDIENMPRVDIVYSHAGADDTAIRAFVDAGAKGIVSAGFGPGVGTPAEIAGFEWAMARGVAVVQSSRTGGPALDTEPQHTMGIVTTDNLTPQKARILLGLALSKTTDRAQLRRIFETY